MQKLQGVVKNLLFSQHKRGKRKPKGSSVAALDRVNLSLGDVRDVFEPYLAIFLTADRHLNSAQVGIAISILVRALLYILSRNPWFLVSVQVTRRNRIWYFYSVSRGNCRRFNSRYWAI